MKRKRYLLFFPYAWLILFFLIPAILVLKISLSSNAVSIPPFEPLIKKIAPFQYNIFLNFENYFTLMTDSYYVQALLGSIKIALFSTIAALLIGYPMAYAMSKIQDSLRRNILFMALMIPFWTSFLIRIYAWITLLSSEGIINSWLLKLGIINAPMVLLYQDWTVVLGITYCYLPFMVLPIYSSLLKLDPVYLEAAADLGCHPLKRFLTITLPLSRGGIFAGCALVFIPAMGEFVIPELLGGPDSLVIGKMIWVEFFNNRDWPLAASLAIMLLTLFIIPLNILQRER